MTILIRVILGIIILMGSLTVFLYLYDGYKQKNIKKGVFYVFGFFIFSSILYLAISYLGIWFAIATPFLLALFFTPILTAVPKCAYGPALIIVGVLMIDSVKKIDFSDMTELIPSFCTIILMSFTYNLGIGITAGLVAYPIVKLFAGRGREVELGAWILGAISLIFYIFYPYQ